MFASAAAVLVGLANAFIVANRSSASAGLETWYSSPLPVLVAAAGLMAAKAVPRLAHPLLPGAVGLPEP
jgi:hypothetical protein